MYTTQHREMVNRLIYNDYLERKHLHFVSIRSTNGITDSAHTKLRGLQCET